MSNLSQSTRDISIAHPELWTLELMLRPGAIDYLLYTEQQSESMHVGTIAVGQAAGTLAAIENAVYDNPLLLDDYKAVRVLVSSPHFLLLPEAVSEPQAATLLAAAFGDAVDNTDAVVSAMPQCGKAVAFAVERGLHGFLNRTFNTPPVYHHLYPLCEHFYRLNSGSSISRMFLNLHAGSMDMVVYRRGDLLVANTYEFAAVDDAAYFALHAWQSLKLDQETDEIQITGVRDDRDELAERLRRYVRYVMPAIYPAATLRLGHDAVKAPLDLVLLTQC